MQRSHQAIIAAAFLLLLLPRPALAAGSPTATPTNVPVSLPTPGCVVVEPGLAGHLSEFTSAHEITNAGGGVTMKCCTAGSSCLSGCSLLFTATAPQPFTDLNNGINVCASVDQDLCLCSTAAAVTGTVWPQ